VDAFESPDGVLHWLYENCLRLALLLVICLFSLMVSVLLAFHCYLASCNFTTWEFLSWSKIEYLKDRPQKVSPFSKGLALNLKEYCFDRFPPLKTWEMVPKV
jgi:hypothetical protein